jgi:ABC-type Fe3+ transport system permease subunit
MSDPQTSGLRARLASRGQHLVGRLEPLVRDFEWTWTKAVVFSLALVFGIMVSMVIIPSFWMYLAEQKLGWSGPSGGGDWQTEVRDAIAMGLTTGPIITVLVLSGVMQNWRRKLRGQSGDVRPTGGYR